MTGGEASQGRVAARALTFLALRTIANRTARVVGRLRSPRYVVALLAGLAYFGWIFGGAFRDENGAGEGGPASLPPWAEGLAPLPLMLLAVVWWTTGRYHAALAYSPAEVHFLFGAPVTRRQLVVYKLAKRQLSVLVTVLLSVLYLWAGGGGEVGGARLLRNAGALWVLVSTLHLHQIGASLARAAAAEQGGSGVRRQGWAFLIFAAAVLTVGASFIPAISVARAAADLEAAAVAVTDVLSRPAPRVALLPLRWLLAPLFAENTAAWVSALPAALLVLALHAVWVVRSDAAFEEGAAEAGRVQAERWRARRQGRGSTLELSGLRSLPRPWFRLAPRGHPAVAIVWKNLTLAARQVRLGLALLMGAIFVGTYIVMRISTGDPQEAAEVCVAMAFTMAGMTLAMGPLAVRNDLRADLKKLELLRTYPLSGRDVVAAEVAASTLLLTLLQFLFLLLGVVFLMLADSVQEIWWLFAGGAAALMFLPPVNALLVGAQNTRAVLFPAWTHVGADRPGGVEATGMFALTLLGTLLFLALALLPAAAFALAVGTKLLGAMGAWTALPAALAGWGVLWGEVALMVVLLGEEYDALDPAEAGLLD